MSDNPNTNTNNGQESELLESPCSTTCYDGTECKEGTHYITVEDYAELRSANDDKNIRIAAILELAEDELIMRPDEEGAALAKSKIRKAIGLLNS